MAESQTSGRVAAATPQADPNLTGRLQRIAAHQRAGNLAAALKECQGLLSEQSPPSVWKLWADLNREAKNRDVALTALQRLVTLLPRSHEAHSDLANMYFELGQLPSAEQHIRQALALNPLNPQAHNLLGQLLAKTYHFEEAVFHYRQVLLLHEPVGALCSNLGNALVKLGDLEGAENNFRMGYGLEPDNVELLLSWAKMEEARRNFPKARELVDAACNLPEGVNSTVAGRNAGLCLREKRPEEALAVLEALVAACGEPPRDYDFYFMRGEVMDRLGRYDAAMADYHRANRLVQEVERFIYRKSQQQSLMASLKTVYTAEWMNQVKAAYRLPEYFDTLPAPIFILGFPRSGTTLVEQILAGHPNISPGDELPYIGRSTKLASHLVGSRSPYPICMAELIHPDKAPALEKFRGYYIQNALSLNIIQGGACRFTDKMPLNEIHLPLIHAAFPDSPLIHVVRHPMDVVLSCYFNQLTHGGNCAFALETAATHYAAVYELWRHYKEGLGISPVTVRYEELVAEPEPQVRRLLAAIDEPWDEACLAFHLNQRYARTASYAQVSEKMYTGSKYRYKNYSAHLRQIAPILAPIVEEMGYELTL